MNLIIDATWKEINECKAEKTYCGPTRQEYMELVEAEGRFIWMPKANELFIDIDTEEHYDRFWHGYSILTREYPEVTCREWASKHGLPRRHILVTLPFRITNHYQRIAYQAALGSDSTRELLSIFRVECGDEYPTLFAEEKERD